MGEEAAIVLKPCPFCGGRPEVERQGTSRCSHIIACTDCGGRLETGETFDGGERWNKRSDDAALSAQVADRDAEIEKLKSRRIHTQEWYARHYGKLEDWARKVLPDPHRTQFFNCIANGAYDHALDVGEPYVAKAGFRVVPTNYFRMDTAEGQLILDQTQRAEDAEAELATAKSDLDMEVARLLKSQDLQIEATTQARNEAASESLWRKQAERERDALKSELVEIRAGRRHILTSSTGEQAPCGGPGLCRWCDDPTVAPTT